MSLVKSVAKNTIFHTIGKFSASAIGIVIVALMTRYLGTTGFGHYATILAYLYFFTIIGDLGLYLITLNELGHVKNKKEYFSNVFTMRLVSGIILMLAACAIIWIFPYPLIVKLGVCLHVATTFLMMLDQVLVALFQEAMQTKFIALSEVIGKIVLLGLILLVIYFDLGFLYIILTFAIGLLPHFVINLFFARRILKFKLEYNKQIWLNILKKSWPIASYMIFSMIYFKADTIILSLYRPASEVGIYGASYKILEVLIIFPAIFMGLISPHLSKNWAHKQIQDFKNIFQRAFDALSMIVWPMIFGVIVLAKPIINLVAGSEFDASIPVLQILIFATGIIFLAHLTTFSVVAVNKQKSMMKYYIFAAVCALILYFIFIPEYSYYAAAIITVLVELFILLASARMVKKTTRIKISFKNNLKSFLIAALMGLVLYFTNFGLFISIILGVVIYFVGLYLTRALDKDLIFEFIKNKR